MVAAASAIIDDMPPLAVLSLAAPHTLSEDTRKQILADVRRSQIPDLPIEDEARTAHEAALERIISAWCVYEPRIGYVQGMNFAVAVCLHLTHGDEEEALLIFAALVARCPPSFFDEGLSGLLIEAAALIALIAERTSLLDGDEDAQMLRRTLPYAVTQWFLTLWAGVLPTDCVLRVWESLLTSDADEDGTSPILLGVAFTLLERHEEALAAAQRQAVALCSEHPIFLALQGAADAARLADGAAAAGGDAPSAIDELGLSPSTARALRTVARRQIEAAARKLNGGSPKRSAKVLAWVSKPALPWKALRKSRTASDEPMLSCQRDFLRGSRSALPTPVIPWQDRPLGKVGPVEVTAGGAVLGATLITLLAI